MTIRYLSYIPDDTTYTWNIGDCFVAHANKQLAFFLYRPGKNGSDFISQSICIAVASYEGERCENMILFHNDALKGVDGKIKQLKSFLSPFENDLIKDILEQSSDILSYKQDVWDSNTIIRIATYQDKLEWKEVQHLGNSTKVITPEVIQHSGGMPPAYQISFVDDCETGTELCASKYNKGMIRQWERYEIERKDGKVVISHPSFGKKEFDRIRMYKSHIIGWNDNKTSCRLFSQNNLSSEYQLISDTCYNDCHIAVRRDGSICLLDGNTTKERRSLSVDYDNIIEIHSFSVVVKKNGKYKILSTLHKNRIDTPSYDEVKWQKEELFFVRDNNNWKVYNNNGFILSKSYREICWVTEDLICGTDGAGNYTIFIPSKNNKALYYGLTPNQFMSDLKKGRLSKNTTEIKQTKPDLKNYYDKKGTEPSQKESAKGKSMSFLIVDNRSSFKLKTIRYHYSLIYSFRGNHLFSNKNLKGKTIYFFNYEKDEMYETQLVEKDTFSIISSFKFGKDLHSVIKKDTPVWYVHEQSFPNHQAIVDFTEQVINRIHDLSINRMIITDEIIYRYEKGLVSEPIAESTLPTTEKAQPQKASTTNKRTDENSEPRKIISQVDNTFINIKKRTVQTYEMQTSLNSYGKKSCIIQTSEDEGVELTPKTAYDETLFNRRIPNNCKYNYYFSLNRDIVILIPNNVLEEMEKTGKYEIKGSGKDPKFSQTIGKNENGKVYHQKEYNSHIYLFSIVGPDRFMFYDEVKYLSHRIEKPEPYKNDVIYFNFESVLK